PTAGTVEPTPVAAAVADETTVEEETTVRDTENAAVGDDSVVEETVVIEETVAIIDEPVAAVAAADAPLASRWPDVIDQVKSRNGLLGSILGSARPVGLEDSVLVVAFSTDFNRKTAEKTTNRQLIEVAFQRIYGSAYRLRGTVGDGEAGAPSLLDDPVINFAQRTFGG